MDMLQSAGRLRLLLALLYSALALLLTTTPVSGQGNCRDLDDGRRTCYFPSSDVMTWNASMTSCESGHRTLAVIQDQATQDFLGQYMDGKTEEHWIGGYKEELPTWTWDDNTIIDGDSRWESSYPKDSECAATVRETAYLWHDIDCAYPTAFICELDNGGSCNANTPDILEVKLKGRCFRVHFTPKIKWFEAQTRCRDESGMLAKVNTEDIWVGLSEALNTRNETIEANAILEFWIGLHNTQWIWIKDETPIEYAKWDGGYPLEDRPCLSVTYQCTDICSEGLWRNADCSERKPYLCQETFEPLQMTSSSSGVPSGSSNPTLGTVTEGGSFGGASGLWDGATAGVTMACIELLVLLIL